MSLVDPAPALLAALTVLVVAAHLALVAGLIALVLRMLGDPREASATDDPDDGWSDKAPDSPQPLPPTRPRTRPVRAHHRRPAGTRRRTRARAGR